MTSLIFIRISLGSKYQFQCCYYRLNNWACLWVIFYWKYVLNTLSKWIQVLWCDFGYLLLLLSRSVWMLITNWWIMTPYCSVFLVNKLEIMQCDYFSQKLLTPSKILVKNIFGNVIKVLMIVGISFSLISLLTMLPFFPFSK